MTIRPASGTVDLVNRIRPFVELRESRPGAALCVSGVAIRRSLIDQTSAEGLLDNVGPINFGIVRQLTGGATSQKFRMALRSGHDIAVV
jgi:hypothetical protein